MHKGFVRYRDERAYYNIHGKYPKQYAKLSSHSVSHPCTQLSYKVSSNTLTHERIQSFVLRVLRIMRYCFYSVKKHMDPKSHSLTFNNYTDHHWCDLYTIDHYLAQNYFVISQSSLFISFKFIKNINQLTKNSNFYYLTF